jgi:hypothetical protein
MPSKPVINSQITVWDDPSDPVVTICGKVSYADWLESEASRIGGCEVATTEVLTSRGMEPRIALFRDSTAFNLRQEA